LKLDDKVLPEALRLSTEGVYETYYAPFEHVNCGAKVVICGITPGVQQALIALSTAQRALKRNDATTDALRDAKHAASFAGTMRRNLAAMLDHVGLHQWLGLESCTELFLDRQDLIHFTSALKNPVLAKGENYSGGPTMVTNTYLWRQARLGLAEEIQMLPEDAVYIPMGKGVDLVFEKLIQEGLLVRDRVLFGLPHASGANSERIAYFCGRKQRHNLSRQTNADSIDTHRQTLRERVGQLHSIESTEPLHSRAFPTERHQFARKDQRF
jgi:hypothetical protein